MPSEATAPAASIGDLPAATLSLEPGAEGGSRLAGWLRSRFSDGHRFLVLCIVVGSLCGLAAVGFHLAIHGLFEWLWGWASAGSTGRFCAILLGAPTLAGLAVGLVVKFLAPETAGSGIPQTKAAYYNHGGKISTRTGVFRFLLGMIYVGLGNSLGREGPTVHFSAAIASRIGRWAFRDPVRVQAMLPVGMAAGIAAAFNAPLSALTFVFEELLDNFSMKSLGGIVVSVVIAAAISRSILGEDPVLPVRLSEDFQTSPWMLVAVPLGIATGLVGHGFVRGILTLRMWFRGRGTAPWLAPAWGGLACGAVALAAWFLTQGMGDARHSVFSIGYDSLVAAFDGHLAVGVIGVLLVGKFLAVLVAYSSGGSGGLFSPTLFLGGMLGGLVGMGLVSSQHAGHWIPALPPDSQAVGGCVLLGMGAMFAAVVRCPFTSLIIIFEMTGNYSLILPLMAGNMIAWQIARRLQPVGIYDSLLLQDHIILRKLPAYRGMQDYRKLPVQAIMSYEVFSLRESESACAALLRSSGEQRSFRAYPVLNGDGLLAGVVLREDLARAGEDETVGDIASRERLLTVFPETPIRDAARQMVDRGHRQVPVVSSADPRKLLGWLTLNDIVRRQNEAEG
ncbi:chloride channel protein [Luteolibacter flavescens]|uniref:Chloride channel protein n=1 Tax=Luteolibacter flavescens TaxID=1859460 RepID=A0ABT3FUQ9_9BACT|nr:chloride channel protein [Luteolibacter flavescens]MCW1887303.1 chloride channel protein [Luteolibacter flavescens]